MGRRWRALGQKGVGSGDRKQPGQEKKHERNMTGAHVMKGFFKDLSSRRFGPRIESSGYRCFSPLFLLFGGEDKVGMRINRNTYAVD